MRMYWDSWPLLTSILITDEFNVMFDQGIGLLAFNPTEFEGYTHEWTARDRNEISVTLTGSYCRVHFPSLGHKFKLFTDLTPSWLFPRLTSLGMIRTSLTRITSFCLFPKNNVLRFKFMYWIVIRLLQTQIDLSHIRSCCYGPYINLTQEKVSV